MGQSLAADLMHHPQRKTYRHAHKASIHSSLDTPASSIMYDLILAYTISMHATHGAQYIADVLDCSQAHTLQ